MKWLKKCFEVILNITKAILILSKLLLNIYQDIKSISVAQKEWEGKYWVKHAGILVLKSTFTWKSFLFGGNCMVVTKRSEKETLFKAYSSDVEVLPSTSHHASSFICKRTCNLMSIWNFLCVYQHYFCIYKHFFSLINTYLHT